LKTRDIAKKIREKNPLTLESDMFKIKSRDGRVKNILSRMFDVKSETCRRCADFSVAG
jgi:hypothetical protein